MSEWEAILCQVTPEGWIVISKRVLTEREKTKIKNLFHHKLRVYIIKNLIILSKNVTPISEFAKD